MGAGQRLRASCRAASGKVGGATLFVHTISAAHKGAPKTKKNAPAGRASSGGTGLQKRNFRPAAMVLTLVLLPLKK